MARVRTETAARVRHIVSRGLLVVGGIVVGTAAAWLLSSATASAESQPHPGLGSAALPAVSIVDNTVTHLRQNPLVRNATKAVKDVDNVVESTVGGIPAPLKLSTVVGDNAGLGKLGEHAKSAFDEVGADPTGKVDPPRTSGRIDGPGRGMGGQPGDTSPIVGPSAHPAPAAGSHRGADGFTAPAVQDRVRMGGLNRGSPVPSLPDPLRLPTSPLPAPAGSSGHSSSNTGGPDGPALGAPPMTGFRTVFAAFGTSRPAVAGAPVHSGAQPGSTPD